MGSLEGKYMLALFLPHFGPRFMDRAFGVIRCGFGAGEFDGLDTTEVLDLVAFGFQPDILDATSFSSHVFVAFNGVFPVVIQIIISEFRYYHVKLRYPL